MPKKIAPKKRRAAKGENYDSWQSFWLFQREASHKRRYIRSSQGQRFLDALAIGCHKHVVELKANRRLYRAQVAHSDEFVPEIDDSVPAPALPDRMIPFRDRATEGRANSKGIPCLYMASDAHTAIAEVRPWIGSLVTLSPFRTKRPLRIIDCTRDADRHPIYINGEPSRQKKIEAVWSHIARAFREPMTRGDDVAGYAATQIIAEVFRDQGFDGLAYRTAFGKGQFNIALFDLDAAEPLMASLHQIRDVTLKFEETANPYYIRKAEAGKSPSASRNAKS